MRIDLIRKQIQSLPEANLWPELVTVFDRAGDVPHPDWELPLLTCQAVGSEWEKAIPGAAAICCLQIGIMLADDILDDDLRGEHKLLGVGPTANLALAFQAAAFGILGNADRSQHTKNAAVFCLAKAALATAYGQHLDSKNIPDESNYWKVLQAKSTPFYGAAFQLGGILGNADQEIQDGLYRFGTIIGEIIQIDDDLEDALQKPANPDWKNGANNLLIVFALSAKHENQERFRELMQQVAQDEVSALEEAQQILIQSGAVSFAAYNLISRYRSAQKLLQELALPYPDHIGDILNSYENNLVNLLSSSGAKISPSILSEPTPWSTLQSQLGGERDRQGKSSKLS